MTDSPPPSPFRFPPSAAVWLATGFGAGLWAPAPGTAGAAIGSLVAWGISYLPSFAWQIAAILGLNLVGIPLCTAAGRALGGKKDNQAIVWDEIMSMPIVFLLVPLNGWAIGLAGFALHRLFDITKPPPARQLEYLPEGLGVMADDWVAAVYAGIALYALVWAGVPLGG
ncbi:MAG: phosphatidylglycerophosphatase A [Pirellulales bacterium]